MQQNQKTVGLRANKEHEIEGLDISEHNLASSYADFVFTSGMLELSAAPAATIFPAQPVIGTVPVEAAVPVYLRTSDSQPETKITKVQVITNSRSFEAL